MSEINWCDNSNCRNNTGAGQCVLAAVSIDSEGKCNDEI